MLGRDVEETTDLLADLDAEGWLSAWERGDDVVVTLSTVGASWLGVRLVEFGPNETPRWAGSGEPEPPRPRASRVFRGERAASLASVVDPSASASEVLERAEAAPKSWRSHRPRAAGRPRSSADPSAPDRLGVDPLARPGGRPRGVVPGLRDRAARTDDVLPPLRSLGARPPARQRPDGEGPRPPRVGRCHRRPEQGHRARKSRSRQGGRAGPITASVAPDHLNRREGALCGTLVAEDNDLTALLIRLSLARLGHEVTIARDGLEAWRLVEEERVLPGHLRLDDARAGGPDLCRRIRDREKTGDTATSSS